MNIEHRTSNIQHRMKKQTPNTDAQRRRLRRVTFNSYFSSSGFPIQDYTEKSPF